MWAEPGYEYGQEYAKLVGLEMAHQQAMQGAIVPVPHNPQNDANLVLSKLRLIREEIRLFKEEVRQLKHALTK